MSDFDILTLMVVIVGTIVCHSVKDWLFRRGRPGNRRK